jgi:cell division protein FtsZ
VIIGLTVNPNLKSELEVLVIATGIATKPIENQASVASQIDDKYI